MKTPSLAMLPRHHAWLAALALSGVTAFAADAPAAAQSAQRPQDLTVINNALKALIEKQDASTRAIFDQYPGFGLLSTSAGGPPEYYNPAYPDLGPPPTTTSTPHVNTAIIPYPQFIDDSLAISRNNIPGFNRLHDTNVARAKQGGIDVMFMGDSITQFWSSTGRTVWNEYFNKPNFVNFGISADRTQNVLWRLQNGEGEGYSPKAIIMMLGTNNLGLEVNMKTFRNTAGEIAAAIDAIDKDMLKRFPDAKILLFGILPRGDLDSVAVEPMRKYVSDVNKIISTFADGKRIFYEDIGPQFLEADGTIKAGYMSDAPKNIHPAVPGYEIWAAAINKHLGEWGIIPAVPTPAT